MKLIRWIVGKIILFLDAVFSPSVKERSPAEKARIAAAAKNLSLYQYEACPFCVKVRRFMKAEGVAIPLKDAKREPFQSELLAGGGKLQVPCLKIEKPDGAAEWMYESSDIIAYLRTSLAL